MPAREVGRSQQKRSILALFVRAAAARARRRRVTAWYGELGAIWLLRSSSIHSSSQQVDGYITS
jgi:hypothetical protein